MLILACRRSTGGVFLFRLLDFALANDDNHNNHCKHSGLPFSHDNRKSTIDRGYQPELCQAGQYPAILHAL